MDIKEIVLDVTEEVLGLEKSDMLENMELNLKEEGLIDSLSSASVMAYIEAKINKKLDFDKLTPDDFISLSAIIAAVERQIND